METKMKMSLNDKAFLAVMTGNTEWLKELLANGADPNARTTRWRSCRHSSLLHIAVEKQRPEIGLTLLEAGADPVAMRNFNVKEETPFVTHMMTPIRQLTLVEKQLAHHLAQAHYDRAHDMLTNQTAV